MKDCGPGEICTCAKYRFKCTKDDQACSKQEQSAEITKWAYIVTSKSVCSALQNPMSGASHVKCCLTNRCNQPDNGKCSWSQSRRRALRKFTDLLDF
ncbi:unnamed protein product [Rotaria sp. Silwood1]|nr:unnamed protein product [Rotaria sp. Silwood1]CAF4748162.1 unnamed protein product [Rotaria sp. Silwood1]